MERLKPWLARSMRLPKQPDSAVLSTTHRGSGRAWIAGFPQDAGSSAGTGATYTASAGRVDPHFGVAPVLRVFPQYVRLPVAVLTRKATPHGSGTEVTTLVDPAATVTRW